MARHNHMASRVTTSCSWMNPTSSEAEIVNGSPFSEIFPWRGNPLRGIAMGKAVQMFCPSTRIHRISPPSFKDACFWLFGAFSGVLATAIAFVASLSAIRTDSRLRTSILGPKMHVFLVNFLPRQVPNKIIRALTRDYKPGTAQSVTIVSLFFGDTFFGIYTNSLNFDAAIFGECIAHKTVTKKRCRNKTDSLKFDEVFSRPGLELVRG